MDTWRAYFGGRPIVPIEQTKPPFWRYNHPGRQILFSAYHTNGKNLDHYVGELRCSQPPWLHGYPSVLALLAAHLVANDLDLGYQVQWITTGSENLLPQQALLINRAFGVYPKQNYGMTEAVANASECEMGKLHIDEDFAAVEFLSMPATDGHKVIGTNLSNLAMPLLRYDVGDIVTLSKVHCTCGRPGRILNDIDGRQDDYLVLNNGALVGRVGDWFKHFLSISEAQVYQIAPGKVTIRLVVGDDFGPADERALLAVTRERIGHDIEIDIEYVERIERTQNGKLRFVVSEMMDAHHLNPRI